MFDGHYKEKQASVIPIPNIRFAVFERMMRCIYTGALLSTCTWRLLTWSLLLIFSDHRLNIIQAGRGSHLLRPLRLQMCFC
jgi:BTB/POZ domain